ncbi:MAG: NIF family HAD-type phosphatase [Rubinisphaera brasiliensis]|uniref:NIF family HAD-type phosphatase n=1 Tax=Rubinisphaera brasiliensis TaxID=119 RepID=UPI003919EFA9
MSSSTEKPLLILDLDETLIHGVGKPLECRHDFRAGHYYIYKRPHIDFFLATVSTAFQLAVWSSSTPDYVATVVTQLFKDDGQLQFCWGRDRCTQPYHPEWQSSYWIKDLKKVKRAGWDLDRVLIVDDTPRKLERNYGNAVYVRPFAGDQDDEELQNLAPYLLSLAAFPNFRSIEKRGWRLRPS